MTDFGFLLEHAIFRPPPNKNSLTNRYETLHIQLCRRDDRIISEMVRISLLGAVPIQVKFKPHLIQPSFLVWFYGRNYTEQICTHNCSNGAVCLKDVPFRVKLKEKNSQSLSLPKFFNGRLTWENWRKD
jgi:hypothetical protein